MKSKLTALSMAVGIVWFGLFANAASAAEVLTEQDFVENVVMKEDFVKTVDNFIIMFDSSDSMNEYINKGTKETKYDVVKRVLEERQRMLPDLGYNAGLYLYTPFKAIYPMGPYDREKFALAMENLPAQAKGRTSLTKGLREIEPVLEDLSGKTAVFIFSDGTYTKFEGMKEPEDYTRELAQKYNLCFYLISSATAWRADKQLDDMAKANSCSRVIPIEAFVNNSEYLTGPLFVVKASAVVETTTETRIVGLKIENVLFDFNQTNVRSDFENELDEVGAFLQKNPDAYVMLVGYTDSIGTEEYNLGLSQRRADSAADYLVANHNITRDRIVVNYYGEANPIDSNDSADGRSQNRRVEIAIGGLK